MARYVIGKNGKRKLVDADTKPHSRPQARDAKGKPFFPSPEDPTASEQAVEASKGTDTGSKA